MPHFYIETNEDGSIAQILRDGRPYVDAVRLEPLYTIVSSYFKLAGGNLRPMQSASDAESLRYHGVQAFLMSLTGVEAFTNVYFQMLGEERNKPDLLKKVGERFGPLVPRLRDCIDLAFGQELPDQSLLLERIQQLYRLRNQIVHPRSDPASMVLSGSYPTVIAGLVENFQATFEDVNFCHEAFFWCLLLVVRVAKAAGNVQVEGFCFFWTGMQGLTEEWLLTQLGLTLPQDDGQT